MFEDIDIYDDAWMFLLGGSNHVSDYWIDKKSISEKIKSGWCSLLQDRLELSEKMGFEYLHVVAPEKLSIYPEKCELPVSDEFIPSIQIEKSLPEELRNRLWINTISFLRKQKEQFQLYAKTDTHWNFVGAYCVYQLIQSKLNRPMDSAILNSRHEGNWTVMDLGGKLDPPLKEKVYFYELSSKVERVYANEIVDYKEKNKRLNDIGLHVGSYVVYRNSEPLVNEVLMLFGDSFSEYRGHLLTGLLAETYREVHFIWNANLDVGLIEKHKPDIVISELAERFMSDSVPNNSYDNNAYTQKLMAKTEAA